ncbi:MAG TPA: hypothetical protein VGL83_08375 [Stellaceae bacterium]|jgi:hypothetical protein
MALPARSAAPPARDAAPLGISGLCTAAAELATLLDRETQLIRAMRLTEIAPLQADKARLTKLCGTALKAIDPKTPIAPTLKDQWRTVSKKLGDAAIANEMALRVGHAATQRLVSAIIGHIQRRRTATTAYARPKPIAPGAKPRPCLAGVTVDRQL